MKEIILPGKLVANEPKKIPGCHIEDGKTYASIVCMSGEDYVVPLKGVYIPKTGDLIVGIIKEERFSGYVIELNSPYDGQLSARDSREELKMGDVIYAKILAVDESKEATIVDPRRLWGGEMMEIGHVKVPRVIGKNSSMLGLIRDATNTTLFVGRNGYVYIKGEDTALAVEAILRICREAHVSGLTERISQMLKEQSKVKAPAQPGKTNEQAIQEPDFKGTNGEY